MDMSMLPLHHSTACLQTIMNWNMNIYHFSCETIYFNLLNISLNAVSKYVLLIKLGQVQWDMSYYSAHYPDQTHMYYIYLVVHLYMYIRHPPHVRVSVHASMHEVQCLLECMHCLPHTIAAMEIFVNHQIKASHLIFDFISIFTKI